MTDFSEGCIFIRYGPIGNSLPLNSRLNGSTGTSMVPKPTSYMALGRFSISEMANLIASL
jgi:hypothetical protein